ncbi:hypothetical protein F5Y12DRAFT_296032 [Xylaria sp. FL1777]|nr:hypothetical protein F5Y12DRAFT_296032 [Xylaria sp. FL1777]
MMIPDVQDAVQAQRDSSTGDHTTDEHFTSSKDGLENVRHPSSSPLENLPVELGTLLLSSMPDLPTLRALVYASPILYAQYRYSRNGILRACLSRELDGFFIDAYASVMSRREHGDWTNEAITSYLNTYKTWLSKSTPVPNIQTIDPSRIRYMVAFHMSVARPMARLYSNWALTNLKKAVILSTYQQEDAETDVDEVETEEEVAVDNHNIKLSRSEEIRFYRALYRYETYEHLFGRERGDGFFPEEIHDIFFYLFDPWEAEAVGCIEIFVRSKYVNIFHQATRNLHPENDWFRHTPWETHGLEDDYDDFLEGSLFHSLEVIARLLTIDNDEALVSELQKNRSLSHYVDAPIKSALCTVAQFQRRQRSANFPDARDEAEKIRDPIQFIGDTVPPDGPPAAWVALWGGRYSNIYGGYVPEPVQQWGYVFWDEHRWIDMGVDDNLLVRQWKLSDDLVDEIESDYDWRPPEC